jgi:uncharacterized protein YacL
MTHPTSLRPLRIAFVILCALLGFSLSAAFQETTPVIGSAYGVAFGLLIVGLDQSLRKFTLSVFSSATFGLMVGVLCAWLVTRLELPGLAESPNYDRIRGVVELALYATLGFLGMSLALRAQREEFALVIPYVRFRQEGLEEQKLLVDSNVLIDGRLMALFETGFLTGTLLVPRFVLDELHLLADASDPMRKERGRRGLESVEQLRTRAETALKIHEDVLSEESTVDAKLTQLAKALGARLLTNDANLGRVAQLQGVSVLNLHALSHAMRPALIPGEEIELALIKPGKDAHQAVGFLPDGTMIVVNHAADRLGTSVTAIVGGSLQTSAGRLIFAELKATPRRA